jgi:hypothetical protein
MDNGKKCWEVNGKLQKKPFRFIFLSASNILITGRGGGLSQCL